MMVYDRLIIEGNAVYEIDDECAREKQSGAQRKGQSQKESRYRGKPRPGNCPQSR